MMSLNSFSNEPVSGAIPPLTTLTSPFKEAPKVPVLSTSNLSPISYPWPGVEIITLSTEPVLSSAISANSPSPWRDDIFKGSSLTKYCPESEVSILPTCDATLAQRVRSDLVLSCPDIFCPAIKVP